MNQKQISDVEQKIGYTFKNKNLLVQAFTRKSYSQEHGDKEHNDVLEFYGDKVAEIVVMNDFLNRFGKINKNGEYSSKKDAGQLTEIKTKLVCKKMFASRVNALEISDYILMGNGDKEQHVDKVDSVNEDLFEAILGAVYIDCNKNIATVTKVVGKMLDINSYFTSANKQKQGTNYIQLFQQWYQKKYKKSPDYISGDSDKGFKCLLDLTNINKVFAGFGKSKQEAKMNCAKKAYNYIESVNGVEEKPKISLKPEIQNAINQLQELFQKKEIGKVSYTFIENHDKRGKPLWHCKCIVSNEKKVFECDNPSKKEGKKQVAYEMLCHLIKK